MKKSELKKIVIEGINNHINMIDEAGVIAANEAKMNKISTYINEAGKLKRIFDNKLMEKFINKKTLKELRKDVDKSINELNKTHEKIQNEQLKLTSKGK